jgi:hypothetical protein
MVHKKIASDPVCKVFYGLTFNMLKGGRIKRQKNLPDPNQKDNST